MTRNVRDILDKIEDFLLEGGQDSADLAAILSIIRGEDGDSFDILERKVVTTCPLRAEIFPRIFARSMAGLGNQQCGPHNVWGMRDSSRYKEPASADSHFKHHILIAAEAIYREDA